MYGKVMGTSATGVGAAILPNTGDSQTLFYIALSVFAVGLMTLVASGLVALNSR